MNNIASFKLSSVVFHTKDDYGRLLQKLKPHIKYVQLFHSVDAEDKVILLAKEKMRLVNQKIDNKFHTSKYGKKMPVYTFEFNQTFYSYLKSFEYIFINTDENNVQFNEDFTQVDMAFLDEEMNLIFLLITHEGLAYLNRLFEKDVICIK